MPAVKADYYELLGVPRDADVETIKKAFHAAARDVHPDVSDSPDAEHQFRDLAEAYSVLSRRESRLLYDRYGYRGRGNSGFDEALWEARERPVRGDNVNLALELRAYEATQGVSRVVRYNAAQLCSHCGGRGTERAPDPGCPECNGTGRRQQVSHVEVGRILQVDPCPVCTGGPCEECGGAGCTRVQRMLKVRIPGGVEDGTQLRVGGEGDMPGRGGVAGDLMIDVSVLPEPRDLRWVRYLAFALFLAAVALLVAYLLLH